MAATRTPPTTATATIESVNPATGAVLGTVPVFTKEDVDATVARARTAAAAWGALPLARRRDALIAYRRALASRIDEIAALVHEENGKPLLEATQECLGAVLHLTHAANRAAKLLRTRKVSAGLMLGYSATVSYEPLGVVGVIGPWNYPVFTPMGSIAYALAAGNAVVFKPSELTPLVGRWLADVAADVLPVPDVLQVVTGDGATGGALASAAVDKIAFTGSTATGKRVMAAAAENLTPVLLELGGKDPLIVAADADVDAAAKSAVWGALTNAGQACVSIERAYVVAPVYDRFVEAAVAEAERLTVGAGDDAHLGAMTRPQQIAQVREQLEEAVALGAKVLVGGPDEVDGNFMRPTLLTDVTDDMRIMREETFGPVLPIIKVPDAEAAIEAANRSPFGLGSSVWGKAGIRAMADRIKAGMTAVNSVQAFSAMPTLPFGGVGESGFGRIHGDEGLREFSHVKSTVEQRFASPAYAITFGKDQQGATKQASTLAKAAFGGGPLDKLESLVRRVLP
jgi:succinate-semialdehyde dehydrogenase/glutarate-semialdehyde dehydrogenase